MNFWTAIVAIVTLACLTSIINAWISQRQNRRDDARNRETDQVSTRLEEMERELRDRIQNLERIVTDDSENLKQQFRDLERDQNRNQSR